MECNGALQGTKCERACELAEGNEGSDEYGGRK